MSLGEAAAPLVRRFKGTGSLFVCFTGDPAEEAIVVEEELRRQHALRFEFLEQVRSCFSNEPHGIGGIRYLPIREFGSRLREAKVIEMVKPGLQRGRDLRESEAAR
jgi:hypothetical protein